MPSSLPRSRSPLIIPPGEDVFKGEINYFAGNLELLSDTAVGLLTGLRCAGDRIKAVKVAAEKRQELQ